MIRKCLAVGIVLLFVGTCIVPGIAQDIEKPSQSTSRDNWLYVGGSGPGNYSKIQDAINASSDGDTVFVFDDSSPYYEHVVINRSISLAGENKETTIIDGSGIGDVVLITKNASDVTVSGFSIQNGRGNWGAGILIRSGYNVITGNIIRNTTYGISLNSWLSSGTISNIIAYNTLINNNCSIDIAYASYHNKVYENYITGSQDSICVWGISMTAKEETRLSDEEYQNDIYNNTITNNDNGIIIYNYGYVNVFQNNITDNLYGIYLVVGYYGFCINNSIYQNNIYRNKFGIFMDVWHKDCGGIYHNSIVQNNITDNEKGIEMISASWNKIQYNTFAYNNFIGKNQTIYLENSLFNRWVGNYWGDARLLPHPIVGKLIIWRFTIPWIIFDWHPAQQPYDIGG